MLEVAEELQSASKSHAKGSSELDLRMRTARTVRQLPKWMGPGSAGRASEGDERLEAEVVGSMWSALSMGPGGYNDIRGVEADLAAVLTTCDAHKANIKLLKHLGSSLLSGAVLLPLLCVQHRTGNVLEQLTKFLGKLGGIFCINDRPLPPCTVSDATCPNDKIDGHHPRNAFGRKTTEW